MSVRLNDRYLKNFISDEDYSSVKAKALTALETVLEGNGKGNDFLGWRKLPDVPDKEEFERIKLAAEKIKKSCDILLVIGIGGSYLGARAAIEFCKGQNYNELRKATPAIYFVGKDLSAATICETLALIEGKDVCLNVISKSGTTTEPAVAFRIFREWMEKGYETFVVPDDVGGRFSVLSAVGLLPIACAGIDIEELVKGAKDSRALYSDEKTFEKNDCVRYAAIRNILLSKGKKAEVLASYEPSLSMTAEWWKQLYGESEGKEKKGLFIQEGTPLLFETVLDLLNPGYGIKIPHDPANADGLNFLSDKELHEVNRTAFVATALAHTEGGVPNVVLELDSRSAYDFGYLVYFFELACAVSGYILGVNPFDQPGVEAYKKNMFALLGKPGEEFDVLREQLSKKI